MKKRMPLKILVFVLMLLASNSLTAQFPILDSLKRRISLAATDRQKLDAIIDLTKYSNSLSADTISYYSNFLQQLATKLKDQKALRFYEYQKLMSLLVKGQTDSVLFYIDNNPLLKIKKQDDPRLYYRLGILKANVFNRKDERAMALDLQMSLLNEAITDKDTLAQLYLMNYLGATYLNIDKEYESQDYWQRALAITAASENLSFREIEAVIHSNIQLIYFNRNYRAPEKKWADSFLFYSERTIQICNQYGFYNVLASSLSYRGGFYGREGKNELADKDFQQVLDIRNKIGDPLYIINDLTSIAGYYMQRKDYDQAIELVRQAVSIAKKGGIAADWQGLQYVLARSYKEKADWKGYSESLESFISNYYEFIQKNSAEKIAAVEAKFELQKKQALIAEQKLTIAKRTNTIIVFGFSFLTIVILAIVYFFNYKKKQKLKAVKAVEEAENRERSRIAAELHDNMGVQANAILHNSSLLSQQVNGGQELINNLQDTAKEMLGNLRETVWALKSNSVTAGETWLRVINFVKQTGKNFPATKFTLDGQAPSEWNLTSVRALHIIMVLKESVNNAIKHANPAEINIKSSIAEGQWSLGIYDNGSGFDQQAIETGYDGNGLGNMKSRSKAGNFKVSLNSVIGSGTSVLISVDKSNPREFS